MANKSLVDWLKEIGQEGSEDELQPDGTIRSMTNDERLARMIWERALGSIRDIEREDGSTTHFERLPDAKAQQFIIERREGKYTEPVKDGSVKPLERISKAIQDQLNATTEQIVGKSNKN